MGERRNRTPVNPESVLVASIRTTRPEPPNPPPSPKVPVFTQPSTNISTSLSSPVGSNTVLWFRSPETLTHNDVWVGMTGYQTPVWEQRYDLGFANPRDQ